jgi:flavin-binding protein dodecin
MHPETRPPRPSRARILTFAALLCATALVAHALPMEEGVAKRPIAPPQHGPRIEVAFVLDTTGSMSGLIEGAKQKIWSIANQMASGQPTPEIRIGLIGYRDRGDAYVTRVHDLDSDLDAIYGQLQAFSANGGGDTPESVNQALNEAVTRLSWSEGDEVYKVVFLVGDAPPHMDYTNDVAFADSVARARRAGIVVNTVQCGSMQATTPIWQAIAAAGAGEYVAIRQDGGMVALASPMDGELAKLNVDLADTIVAWGGKRERAELETKRRQALSASAPAAVSRLGYLAKTGGRANSGRSDLLDAVKSGEVDARELEDDQLPAEMQTLADEERGEYLKQKLAAREAIQARIAELTTARDAWVTREQERLAAEGKGDGFDQKVLDTLRSQAAAKGIAY